MNKIKVAIIGSRGLPANYGGFETLAEYLTLNTDERIEYLVYCSSKAYDNKLKEYNGAKLYYIPLDANGIQSIPYDNWSFFHAMRRADVLLILGVSGCVTLPFIKLFTRKKLIINIDGLEWKRDKWGRFAKWFNKLSEKVAVKNGDMIVSDNVVIQKYVLDEYSKKSTFIPYGANHACKHEITDQILSQYPFLQSPYAFKVCRIEPENNIHVILEAFRKTSYSLVIIGNWQKNNYGKNLYQIYSPFENIHLLDPIYDLTILDQFRSNCSLYVHGHSAGGTNPSLVEAMYLGLPVVAFDINYNRETTHGEALFYKTAEDLQNIIEDDKLSEKLVPIAKKLEEIAKNNYTWEIISLNYTKLFIECNKQ